MKKKLKTFTIVVLLFFTLFPVTFIFLPSFLSTRHLVAILGFFIWFLYIFSQRKRYYDKRFLTVFSISILISLWALWCTLVFNISNDYTYVKHPITLAIMFYAVCSCIFTIRYFDEEVNFGLVTKYYIYALLLQSLLVILQFFNPEFANTLLSIQRLSERVINISSFHLEDSSRFIGFGLFFYTASFFYGTALILVAFLIKHKTETSSQALKLYFLYILFFFIGMGLSRSTIIGFTASLLIFVFPIKNPIINLRRSLSVALYLFIFVAISLALLSFNSKLLLPLQSLFNNAFDFLIAYFETGVVESDSAKGTFEMIVLPEQLRTYFFGTGLYEMYVSIGDYRYSDTGYLRLLYYFGLPGLILFIWLEIKLLQYAFKKPNLTPIFYAMLILLLVTNIKGLTTLAIISMLFAINPAQKKDLIK